MLNAEPVEDAQQHIARLAHAVTHLVREYKVTIPLERAVDSADEDHGHFFMGVPMRIAHVASLVDQHVVQNAAVSVGYVLQLFDELRQILYVIPVDLGIVCDVLRLVAVMRRAMPRSIEAGFGEVVAREIVP